MKRKLSGKRKLWIVLAAVTLPLVVGAAGCPPVKQPVKEAPPTTTTAYPPSP